MKKKVFLSAGAVACVAVLGAVALPAHQASTYGPNRTWFESDSQAAYPVFNSITDNAAVGAERDFVRVMEVGTNGEYVNTVKVVPGREYQVCLYYRNDADPQYNGEGVSNQGVASQTRLSSSFPSRVKPGERGEIKGTITWKNYDGTSGKPGQVYDEAYLTADSEVEIALKPSTAKIYNDEKFGISGTALDATQLFSETGTLLGVNTLDGVVLGGEEYAGQVVYSLTVKAVESAAPAPVAPVTPTVPVEEVPETGPTDIMMPAVFFGVVIALIVYLADKKTSRR